MLTLTLTLYSRGEEKGGKYSEKENIFFLEEEKNKEGKYLEEIFPKFSKDIEKSRSRDLCQFLEGFGFGKKSVGFGKFGIGKKSRFRFQII